MIEMIPTFHMTDAPMVHTAAAEVSSTKALSFAKESSAPVAFDNLDAENFTILGGALCFDIEALTVDGFVDQYSVDGWSSRDIPFEWTQTWCRRHHCAFLHSDLIRRRSMGLEAAHRYSCEKFVLGLERLRTEKLSPVGQSILVHCTIGEKLYLKALQSIPVERIKVWCGASSVDPACWVLYLPQNRIEFLYNRYVWPYWKVLVNNEGRLWLKHGRAIPYQFLVTFALAKEFFKHAFTRLTLF